MLNRFESNSVESLTPKNLGLIFVLFSRISGHSDRRHFCTFSVVSCQQSFGSEYDFSSDFAPMKTFSATEIINVVNWAALAELWALSVSLVHSWSQWKSLQEQIDFWVKEAFEESSAGLDLSRFILHTHAHTHLRCVSCLLGISSMTPTCNYKEVELRHRLERRWVSALRWKLLVRRCNICVSAHSGPETLTCFNPCRDRQIGVLLHVCATAGGCRAPTVM